MYKCSQVSYILILLERLVKILSYSLTGYTSDKLVYFSTLEGVLSIWSMDPISREKTRLTIEPVHGIAPPKPNSPYIVFTRDISRDREPHKLFYVDVRGNGEKLLADTPPKNFIKTVFALGRDFYVLRGENFKMKLPVEIGRVVEEKTGVDKEVILGIRPEHIEVVR